MPSLVADPTFLYPMEEKDWLKVINDAAQQLSDEYLDDWDYLLVEAQLPWIERRPPRERLQAYLARDLPQWELLTATSPRMAQVELLDFSRLLGRYL